MALIVADSILSLVLLGLSDRALNADGTPNGVG
jgi:hypothetical protein